MAKNPRAGLPKVKSQNFNSRWLKNAMKSIGISANEVIKDIAPNLHEVSSTGVKASSEIVASLRRNASGVNRVNDTLKQNKYVQFANKAYKNALTDIKTGNFNNTERASESFNNSLIGDLEEATDGFSFGDDGADSNVNINIGDDGSSSIAISNLGQQIQNQAIAQTKMTKANMDAYIAVSSAGMQQIGQLGSEIINQLSNVNSNLAAIVQYNNENMSRFIEASMGYYDKVGTTLDSQGNNDKVTASSVLYGGNGGVNLSRYKSYVKQQAKEMLESSDVGLLKSMADDPMLMDMIASNPLGFLSKGITSYMMPTVLKTSLESVDKTLSAMLPNLLSQLADLAEDETSGFVGTIKRTIGNVFGLKNQRIETLNGAKIERGAIPFDGETKHAITEIITKELRSQTGYLEIIANHFDTNAKKKMKDNAEYWDWESNSYIKHNDIDKNIGQKIVDSIEAAFSTTDFGREMQSLINTQEDDNTRKELEFTIKELYTLIEQQNRSVNSNDVLKLINETGADDGTKKSLRGHIHRLRNADSQALNSINIGRILSQQSANDVKSEILNDPYKYNLLSSSFNGTEIDKNGDVVDVNFDNKLKEVMGYGKENSSNRRVGKIQKATIENNARLSGEGTFGRMIASAGNHANDVMKAIMSGDASQIFDKGAAMISDQIKIIGGTVSKALFGEKDSESKLMTGGIFSGLQNSLIKAGKELSWMVTGKGYDSEHPDNDQAIMAQFRHAGDVVKDSVMSKLFGKEKDESGRYVKSEDSNGGIFGSVVKTFTAGFNGWMDAFFGTDESEDPEKARKDKISEIKDNLQKSLPTAIGGAAVGAGVGLFSGGSLLGTIVGGPLGGVAMGAASGFLIRNEKFQNWLFGEKDEEGNRTGGLISKDTQKFFKDNKDTLVASSTIGAGVGLVTGGGVLGSLVGGPIAGAMLGTATGIILKSKTFNEFLFGDEEKGQKGIIKGVKDAWNTHFQNDGDSSEGMKLLGMTSIGTATGGLLGLMAGGPVVGAMAGLAFSIKAQSGNFKEWLFGKEEGLDVGDGRKAKKQGLVGRIGNLVNANILRPMATELKFISKDFMNELKGNVLYPFSFAAEALAGKLGDIATNITSGVKGTFSKITGVLGNTFNKLLGPVTNAIGTTMSKATDIAYKSIMRFATAPGHLFKAIMDVMDIKNKVKKFFSPVTKLFKDVGDLVKSGVSKILTMTGNLVKSTFKSIFNVVAAPFKAIGWVGKKVGGAISKKMDNSELGSNIKSKYRELRDKYWDGGDKDSIMSRMHRANDEYKDRKKEIAKEKANNKRHDKNAKLIAKASNGQFSEDTDEARTWLYYHKRDVWKKLQDIDPETGRNRNTSVTEENRQREEDARIEREGRGTHGMSADQLSNANPADLNEEGRQTYYLHNIYSLLRRQGTVGNSSDDDESSVDLSRSYEDVMNDSDLSSEDKQKYVEAKKNAIKARLKNKKDKDNEANNSEESNAEVNDENGGNGKGRRKFIMGGRGPSMKDILKKDQENSDKAEKEHKATLVETSKNKLASALDKAKTAKEIKAEKEKEEEKKDRKSMLSHLKEHVKVAKEHASNWSSVFSKKGIITSVLMAALLWAGKNMPGILKNIGTALSTVVDTVGNIFSSIGWTEKEKARTNGNSAGEQAAKNIQDIKDGNILTDEDGNATSQTNARMKLIKSTARNFAQSNKKRWFDSKITKTEKKIFNGVKAVGRGVKKTGEVVNKGAKKAGLALKNTNELAKWAAEEGDEVYDVASNVAQKYGAKAINKAKSVGTKIASTKTGTAVKNVAKKVADSKAVSGAKTVVKGAKAAKTAAKNAGTKLVTKVADSGGGKMLKKIIGYVTDFFNMIIKKFSKKSGKKVAGGSLGKIGVKKIAEVLTKKWPTLGAKLTAIVGTKTATGAATLGLSDVVFATLDAIDGLSGTAKLFQVDSSKVDGKMRAISTIMGAITGTTVGSILDVVFSFVGDILGFDILHEIAVSLYNLWVGGNSDKAKDLEANMESFKDAYKDYQDNAIVESYEDQLADGTLDPSVTLKEFIKGVEDGTYKAEYKSFQDWNVEQNGSISDKVIGGVGKVVKGAGKAIKKGASFVANGAKKAGKAIKKGAKVVGSVVKKGAGAVVQGAKDLFTDPSKFASNVYDNAKNAVGKAFDIGKGIFNNIGKPILAYVKGDDDKIKLDVPKDSPVEKPLEFATKGLQFALIPARGIVSVGKKAVGLFKNVFGKLKNVFNKIAPPSLSYIKGDSDEIKFDVPDDNPGKPIINLIGKLLQFGLTIPRGVVSIGKKIGGFFGNVISGAKDLIPKVFNQSKDYVLGNSDSISLTDSEGISPLGVVGTVLNHVLLLPRTVVGAGKKVASFIGGAISTAKEVVPEIFNQSKDYVLGNSDSISLTDENGLSPLGVVGNVLNHVLTLPRTIISVGKKVGNFIGGAVGTAKAVIPEIITQSKDYVLGNSDSISLTDEEGLSPLGIIGSVLSHVLSIPKTIISAGKGVVSFFKSGLESAKNFGKTSLSAIKKYIVGDTDTIDLGVKDDGIMGSIANVLSTVLSVFLTPVRMVASAVDGVVDVVKDVKDTVVDGVNNAKDAVKNTAKNAGDKVKDVAGKAADAAKGVWDFFAGGDGEGPRTKLGGGRGTYYSQNDARWKNASYSIGDGATMGDTGCGPTAMAMVASDVTGKHVNPMQMASLAKATGDRDETGTNWSFINKASNMMGMKTEQTLNPTVGDISSSLSSGNPVILSGTSGGRGENPYTKAGHYVVATGIDSDGNVSINDPRGMGYNKKYNINDLAENTGSAWSFGGNGPKAKKGNKKKKANTKKASSNNTTKDKEAGGNLFTAADVIKIAIGELGYKEKASASSLDSKDANPGSKNHTKYEKEVFGSSGNYWCASFVSWCFYKAANGDKKKAKQVLGTLSMAADGIRQAMMNMKAYDKTPRPGDCVFFSGKRHSGANHIAIVVEVNGNTIKTVEGNTSSKEYNDNGGCVASHTYKANDSKILGYGHPRYDGSSTYNGDTSSSTSDGGGSQPVSVNGLSDISSLLSNFLSNAASGISSGNKNFNFDSPFIDSSNSGNNDSSGSSSDSDSSGANIKVSDSAVKRVFNDTWQYEMGKKGPGCYHEPLNDGAGWNYGIASFTQKHAMDGLLSYLGKNYPKLREKLKGKVGTNEFNKSWAALGKSDEEEFFNAQLKYLFNTSLDPALSSIKKNAGVDLNNGKYSEGVFSLLLSMANQRPAWTKEKWVPYLKKNKNATSADIINGIGGDLAKNYSGNYAKGIKSRYEKQVKNSLKLTDNFVYNKSSFGGKGDGVPKQNSNAVVTKRKFNINGGKGELSSDKTITSVVKNDNLNYNQKLKSVKNIDTNDITSLFNTMVELLSEIADNTSASSSKLDALKQFKKSINSSSNEEKTNIIVSDTKSSSKTPKKKSSRTSSKNTKRADAIAYEIARGGV